MTIPFSTFTTDFDVGDHAYVKARAEQLIAEEMALRDLRKARDLTQVQLARILGIGQEHVSRLEKRADMMLSTLASYVRAMGGNLQLLAEFPDRPPVLLADLGQVLNPDGDLPTSPKKPTKKRAKKSKSSV